jgi:hypothetical protein
MTGHGAKILAGHCNSHGLHSVHAVQRLWLRGTRAVIRVAVALAPGELRS